MSRITVKFSIDWLLVCIHQVYQIPYAPGISMIAESSLWIPRKPSSMTLKLLRISKMIYFLCNFPVYPVQHPAGPFLETIFYRLWLWGTTPPSSLFWLFSWVMGPSWSERTNFIILRFVRNSSFTIDIMVRGKRFSMWFVLQEAEFLFVVKTQFFYFVMKELFRDILVCRKKIILVLFCWSLM